MLTGSHFNASHGTVSVLYEDISDKYAEREFVESLDLLNRKRFFFSISCSWFPRRKMSVLIKVQGGISVDEVIKEFLRQNPGSSSHRILQFYLYASRENRGEEMKNYIFSRLRRLKKQKVLLNKGDRWYLINCKTSVATDARRTK
jgi:hypothetical protein